MQGSWVHTWRDKWGATNNSSRSLSPSSDSDMLGLRPPDLRRTARSRCSRLSAHTFRAPPPVSACFGLYAVTFILGWISRAADRGRNVCSECTSCPIPYMYGFFVRSGFPSARMSGPVPGTSPSSHPLKRCCRRERSMVMEKWMHLWCARAHARRRMGFDCRGLAKWQAPHTNVRDTAAVAHLRRRIWQVHLLFCHTQRTAACLAFEPSPQLH